MAIHIAIKFKANKSWVSRPWHWKRFCTPVLAVLFFLTACFTAGAADGKSRRPLLEKPLPPPPVILVDQMVGYNGGAVIAAGGADPSSGRLSDDIWILRDGAKNWEQLKLEQPLAGAAVATVGTDLIFIGGRTESGPSASVFKLTFSDGKIIQTAMPDLSVALQYAGAAAIGKRIYVTGGEGSDGQAKKELLVLDLAGTNSWKVLPDFPGPGLRRPIVTVQANVFLVFGGETVENGKVRVVTDSWMYRPKPQDAMRVQGWIDIADLPAAWVAPAIFPSGQSHVMILGGMVADGMSDDRILIYHVVTDTFVATDRWSGSVSQPKVVRRGKAGLVIFGTAASGSAAAIGTPVAVQAEFAHVTRKLQWPDYTVIGLYLAVLVWIGVHFSKKETTTKEYFLGGRQIPWWAAGISLYAAGTSGISFMALPTKSWVTSTLYGVEGLFALIGTVMAAFLVIPILRRLDITSTYHYLERRFNPVLRLWGSGLNIIFQMGGRMSVVLLLPSMALAAVTGLPVIPLIVTLGVLCTLYTVVGGMGAVIWADVLQVIVLFGGAILAFVMMIVGSTGGASGWLADNLAYDKLRAIELSFDFSQPVIWIVMMNAFLYIGTACSDQVLVQRVLTTPDVKQARRAYLSLALIVLPGSLLFTFLGTTLFSYFRAHAGMMNPAMQDIDVFPLFMVNGLPPGLCGLVIAGLFAASLSTLDSSMNSVSALLVSDFYKRFKRDATDRQCLGLGKFLTAFVGLSGTGIAVLMATMEIKSMFDLWSQIVSLILGGFGGVFILGMFTRRANGWGALVGAATSVMVTACVRTFTPLHFLAYGAVGIISCVVTGYVASLLIPCQKKDLTGLTIFTPGRDETAKGYQRVESNKE